MWYTSLSAKFLNTSVWLYIIRLLIHGSCFASKPKRRSWNAKQHIQLTCKSIKSHKLWEAIGAQNHTFVIVKSE